MFSGNLANFSLLFISYLNFSLVAKFNAILVKFSVEFTKFSGKYTIFNYIDTKLSSQTLRSFTIRYSCNSIEFNSLDAKFSNYFTQCGVK